MGRLCNRSGIGAKLPCLERILPGWDGNDHAEENERHNDRPLLRYGAPLRSKLDAYVSTNVYY